MEGTDWNPKRLNSAVFLVTVSLCAEPSPGTSAFWWASSAV
jgi:hypothetical protein